jgi:hypothetical protein
MTLCCCGALDLSRQPGKGGGRDAGMHPGKAAFTFSSNRRSMAFT